MRPVSSMTFMTQQLHCREDIGAADHTDLRQAGILQQEMEEKLCFQPKLLSVSKWQL